MKEKVILNGQTFKSMSKAKEYACGILHKYQSGQRISEDDSEFIWAALGIRGIVKNPSYKIVVNYNGFGSIGFEFLHPDGQSVPFSYRKCFEGHSGRSKTPHEKTFLAACRTAIALDHPTNTGMQYHHEGLTFKEIVDNFLTVNNIDIFRIKFKNLPRGGVAFLDVEFESHFRKFHERYAKMVPVTQEEHKEIHRKLRKERPWTK